MLKTILVAFDGSDPSTRAFALSLEFATRFNADVLLARVTPSHEFDAMQEERMDEICEEMRNLCREAMRNGV
ncbi:MAG TPA: hypothetical protein DCK93_05275, partial [Blastocatellia bacterium]|nr:hypothetical protein [Blastocatellia bacterium]